MMMRRTSLIAAWVVCWSLAGCAKEDATSELDFGKVIAAAKNVKSYQYNQTVVLSEGKADGLGSTPNTMTTKVLFTDSGVMRCEEAFGTIRIFDSVNQKVLVLDPTRKKATLTTFKGRPSTGKPSTFADELQALTKSPGQKNLGTKIINGRKAGGIQFTRKNFTETLWIDLKTKLPIEKEILQIVDDPFMSNQKTNKILCTDYVYNPVFKPLFVSLKPPAGYTLTEQEITPPAMPLEKDFVAGLKIWTELNGDQFPDEMDIKNLMKFLASPMNPDPKDREKTSNKVQAIQMQVLRFAQTQYRDKHDWRYVGKGVKLGEKDKAVYWYQPEEGKPYRVVYGDLSVKDLPAEKLPTTQPATQKTGM